MKEQRIRWSSKRELMILPVPVEQPSIEYPHLTQPGFFVRVMRKDKKGRVRRTYIHRYKELVPDSAGGYLRVAKNEPIGLVEPLEKSDVAVTLEDAMRRVLDKRKTLRDDRQGDGGSGTRMTVDGAWAFYDTEKATHREATIKKDKEQFTRYLSHLKDRFLDELNYGFWMNFVAQLREGTLVVGIRSDPEGKPVPAMLGPLSNATLIGIMNTAIALFEIGHNYGGLHGLDKRDNPAREARKKIGSPNKKKSNIPLKNLGTAWNASDVLISPWWRDMFRVYLLTGLRKSLVDNMRFDEIDLTLGVYVISPHKVGTKRRGKNIVESDGPIYIPLSTACLNIIQARRLFAPDPQGWVWYTPKLTRGRRVKADKKLSDARGSWTLIEDEIGGLHFSPHDLRRTFATVGSVATKNLYAVSLLMLHSSGTLAKAAGIPEITLDYINTAEGQSDMRDAAEKIAKYIMDLASKSTQETSELVDTVLPDYLEEALLETA